MVGISQPHPCPQLADMNLATEEELNEEDQQLKNDLDMMVERLTVSCQNQNRFRNSGRAKLIRG